jgi:N-acetylglucosaminyl-diphospho-decaprenol L-rhamnosyltransferase
VSTAPRVSVLVVSFNTKEDVLRCLASVREHAGLPCEVVVVDNASQDGTVTAVRAQHPDAVVIENAANLGFGAANNRGLARSSAPFVLLLNSDAELPPGALPTLLARLEARPDAGVVGPRTVDGDGVVQVSFGPPLTPMQEWRQWRLVRGVKARRRDALAAAEGAAGREHEPAWVSASCLLARREALAAVGGFDEGFFLYEEDVDLCQRLRQAGWRVLFTPAAQVVHHLGRSMARAPERARLEYHRSHLRYYRKHNGPAATLALRAYLGGLAVLDRLRGARGPAADLFRLAWHGE